MADYQKIMRLRPEVREYVRNGGWVHRGDVVTYKPGRQCSAFSTDDEGFRHTMFAGQPLSVADCAQQSRYGVVLGSSHVFGFGLPGNEHSIPSVLSERLGFPFANIGLPEASSRNLFSVLLALVARSPNPPAGIVLLSGGDFTSFCYTTMADPVFGSPNIRQFKTAVEERGGRPAPGTQIQSLLLFTTLWTRAIADLCRANSIPLIFGDDTTFFEKAEPTPIERQSRLGTARHETQQRQFATHKAFFPKFREQRASIAGKLGITIVGTESTNALGFTDEFHYDADGARVLSGQFAQALIELL